MDDIADGSLLIALALIMGGGMILWLGILTIVDKEINLWNRLRFKNIYTGISAEITGIAITIISINMLLIGLWELLMPGAFYQFLDTRTGAAAARAMFGALLIHVGLAEAIGRAQLSSEKIKLARQIVGRVVAALLLVVGGGYTTFGLLQMIAPEAALALFEAMPAGLRALVAPMVGV